ncbi:MAG: PIN domain-containing protein [Desulfofustis sp. PB-SRB1]|jgi:predicted nucleic acid-binding protein|nr:PIN domain-containing protein [Desulfofustis sp. PB-SRB1]MBM1004006.1 PIN domain-containing protein [Desulfofustis sp. PB-SRB1]
MKVLVDYSVWIDYFKSGERSEELDYLIDNNLIYINDLILTELIPSLKLQHQSSLIAALKEVARLPLSIHWQQIQELQLSCLKNGINGIGIPDLIIAQNAMQNVCLIFSLDKHFSLMQEVLNCKVY